MTEWAPSLAEIRVGQEAYLRYVGGLAIVNTPDTPFAEGVLGQAVAVDPKTSLEHAERLMYSGLQGVIRQANPPQLRHNAYAERNYEHALPYMIDIVDSVYTDQIDRLLAINPALPSLRPAPIITSEPLYKFICHSRRTKIYTAALLDGLKPAPLFADMLEGRTLAATRLAKTA